MSDEFTLTEEQATRFWMRAIARGCTCEAVDVAAHVTLDGGIDVVVTHLDEQCPLNPGANRRQFVEELGEL